MYNLIFLAPKGALQHRSIQLFQLLLRVASPLYDIFVSQLCSLYRSTAFRSSPNDNDKTHFLSFPVDSTLLPPSPISAWSHYVIIIIPRLSFFRPGIDGIINKHHANYSATRDIINIFSSPPHGNTPPATPDVTINHSTHKYVSTHLFLRLHVSLLDGAHLVERRERNFVYRIRGVASLIRDRDHNNTYEK